MKVHIYPSFAGEDKGDGGIRRVVEAQMKHLPAFDVELVDAKKADIIACHAMAPDTYFNLYPDKSFVAHNHGLYWAEYDWPAWAIKANKDCMELIRRADLVTAPSEWVAQVLRRHTMRDVVPVGHGISLEEFSPADEQWGYVLWNKTRVDPICDPSPVNALAKLMPQQKFVTTFGQPAENVVVSGVVPYEEAKEVLARAGVYLCTTRETFGIGTLEAMASGVPVVGWAWGGQCEIIEHKKTGWLVEPGDFKGLAEGVHWALGGRVEIAERSRELVEKQYPWPVVIQRYADLYSSLLRRPAGPKVSVVVTAYSLEQYLPECLQSILAQTLQDWECIIVDDASPDNCGAIADEWQSRDPRFRAVHNAENQYLAGARNTGASVARGQYILPLDADDMLAAPALELLAKALDKDRSIHVAYGNVLFLEPDGKTWHSGWPMPYRHDWQLSQRNLLPYCSMFRRQVWEVTKGYRTRCRTAEDADFWCRASSYGFRPAMVTNSDTLIYRNRHDSMSREIKMPDWSAWFPWSTLPEITPAGAVTEAQMPVPSLEPVKVSVIIPVGLGHEKLVQDAIDSVDAQTFRRWECIVVNDSGHQLNLPSWVKLLCGDATCPCNDGDACHYQGKKPMAYTPKGVAAARNLGIKASTARLFVPLDADDFLQPDCLEVLLQVWEEVKGGVIYSDWWQEFADGSITLYEAPDYDPKLLTTKGCIYAVTALYSKADWELVGGFDEKLEAWEDWDYQLKLADKGICGSRVPSPLWVYRKHTGFRREDHYARKEETRAIMMAQWPGLWEDGEKRRELMACGGCRQGGARMAPSAPPPMRKTEAATNQDVVVVEYTGAAQGGRSFRAPTGTTYRFDGTTAGRLKYVLREDAKMFEGRRDFRVLDLPSTQHKNGGEKKEGPELIAAGPPRRDVVA